MAGNMSIVLTALLPPSIEDLGEEMQRHMREESRLGARVAWTGAAEAALNAIRDKLSFDVGRAIAGVWSEVEALREYGDPGKHPPGREEHYALGTHRVELEAKPQLVISLGPIKAPPMTFGYTVAAKFEAVMLTIRDNSVQAAALGGFEATGVLSLKGRQLHKPCPLADGRLTGRLVFDPPVRIP